MNRQQAYSKYVFLHVLTEELLHLAALEDGVTLLQQRCHSSLQYLKHKYDLHERVYREFLNDSHRSQRASFLTNHSNAYLNDIGKEKFVNT